MNVRRCCRVARQNDALPPLAALAGLHAVDLGPVGTELNPDDVVRPEAAPGQCADLARVDRGVALDCHRPHAAALLGRTERFINHGGILPRAPRPAPYTVFFQLWGHYGR